MKAIFIAFDQAHYEAIIEMLDKASCRGFTSFDSVKGRGSKNGEPHYGSHAWPSLAQAIITIVDDSKVDLLLSRLNDLNEDKPKLGLRAFVWAIEKTL